MRNYNTMLHMKLNSAVCLTALLAFLPSSAFAGICFLPDCMDEDVVQGDFNMNLNEDSEYCEKEGYTYYISGKCPQYQDVIAICPRDDHYLKCDAETWCKNNGYNTTSCSLPSYLNEKCPNDYPLYKECKEDPGRACREAGYVNSCSPGRLYANSNRCPWDSSYGKCCTAAPSSGCPANYGVDCTGSASGTDDCGYTCYKCCDDTCPAGTSKNYSGTYTSTTECGTSCYRCKDCTSGSTSYSGSYVGSSECGSCYACDDTCKTGSASVDCSPTQNKVRVSSTECGTSCYSCEDNPDCSVEDKSCLYGCSSYNSCGKCTACGSNPDCDVTSLSCTYGCSSYNTCNKCISCGNNPDCDVTSLNCTYGCASYNSCNKCTSCDSCSDSCSTGSTSSSCPSGYTANVVGSTQCGNTCYSCVKDADPCEGVSGETCASGYHCSSYGSCGECTACEKDECTDTCSSKGYQSSQPSHQICSTTTVCGQTCYYDCKEDPNCAATPAVCDYGCSSYNSCGICTICKPAPCRYGITAEDCASDCMNVGSQSCTRNGITYYASCGSSKCSSSQSCIEGNCYTPSTGGPGQRGSFICCDTVCNDYTYCKKYGGYEDCSSVMPSYTARGCDFTFGYCRYDAGSVYTYLIYGTCAY